MFHRAIVVALFHCLFANAGGEQQTMPLPSAWHGTWKGKVVTTTANDKSSEVMVKLRIEPIKGTCDVTWTTTYVDGVKTQVRDYRLVPDSDKPGRFRIDERNGVLLDARLVNGVIYSQFKVGGSVLTARYELRGDILRLEVTSAMPADDKSGTGAIQALVVGVVQTAELKKT
jgi:hypothetical protein